MSYFNENSAPSNLDSVSKSVLDFLSINQKANKKVALVTSGGTTVPLEINTVRFLDNFSAGTRGATSAEYFIEAGYAVIFLHRQFSLEPYTRHYTHSKNCFLDLLEFKNTDVCIKQDHLDEIREIMKKYQEATASSLLLKISFTTVTEYLYLLRSIAILLMPLGKNVLFYLAAAVSDFYIPQQKMIEHKIQSGDGKLHLDLDQVPKIIKPLVEEWALDAFVVSFKLETDSSILISKSRAALDRYGHSVVVANLLSTRKHVVWLVTKVSDTEIRLTKKEQQSGVEIEKKSCQKTSAARNCLMGRPRRAAAVKAVNKLENINQLVNQSKPESIYALGPSSESEFEQLSDNDLKSENSSHNNEFDLSGGEEEAANLVEENSRKSAIKTNTKRSKFPNSSHSLNLNNDEEEDFLVKNEIQINLNYVASEDEEQVEEEIAEDLPPDFNHKIYLELIECLKKAFAYLFKNSSVQATIDETVVEVMILDTSNTRIPCPFSFCTKSFLNFEGIKYHLSSFIHDIAMFECQAGSDEANQLFDEIKIKRALIPSNLYPIEIPWGFNTKERSKHLMFKVKFSELDQGNAKKNNSKNFSSDKNLLKAMKSAGKKNVLTQKLTNETAELDRKVNSFDGNTYFDQIGCLSTTSQDDVYTPSFFDEKELLFTFINDSKVDCCPLLTGIYREQKNSEKYIINCGLSVWALDWVPSNESDIQYLAVGGYTDYGYHHKYTVKQTVDLKGVIQIWSVKAFESPKLAFSINHNFGSVLELKWCPNNACDYKKNRLGYLAAIFGDGSCQVIQIPFPSKEASSYLKWEQPIFKVNSKEGGFTNIDWSSRNWLVTGSSNGNVCVWDLSLTLTKKFDIFSEILPNLLLYVNLNDNIVTSLCFFEVNGNIYIISASADGSTICMDLRDPDSFVKISKSQGIVHAICAIGSIELILVAEDLRIRGYQMSDDFSEIQASYVTSQHKGAVWMIENSPFFPFLASASSDGALNLANSVRPLKKKIGGVYIYTLFEIISYDNATNTITFNDRLKEKKLEECKLSVWSPRVAVQRIKWNPNRKRKHLIASAGIGWIRIDSALMK